MAFLVRLGRVQSQDFLRDQRNKLFLFSALELAQPCTYAEAHRIIEVNCASDAGVLNSVSDIFRSVRGSLAENVVEDGLIEIKR